MGIGERRDGMGMTKPLSVNPFKTSPALGAAYALQGIKGAVALFHAAPGCTFLGKVLLTQHMKEPVGIVGTDIKEMPTIMGGSDELKNKIIDVHKKLRPSLIGVIGTALSEVRGEDTEKTISDFKFQISNCEIIYVPCPDFMGGFGDGYAKAVETLIENLVSTPKSRLKNQITILPSASLTIGDIEEIKDIVSVFGLRPMVLPDLSLSMDGSKDRYSMLPADGVTMDDINLRGQSSAVIAVGEAIRKAGEALSQKCDIPLFTLKGVSGLEATDELIKLLASLSGNGSPECVKRWRRRLVDGMVDTHLLMAEKKVSIGLEGDIYPGVAGFCKEMGMEIIGARRKGHGANDLEDLEDTAQDADLVIANSHGKEISERLGIPLLRMGFPVYDRFGEAFKAKVGYRGSLNLLFEMANIFQEEGGQILLSRPGQVRG